LRKVIFIFCLLHIICQQASAQYWQQRVNYSIDVSLNDKEHSLEAFENIDYFNNSPDTLNFIWFHLWPNAYKNDKTAFTDQSLENGNTRFYFSDKEEKGYINKLDFKVNNTTAETEDHPQYIDIVKLILPSPLLPGQKVNITTPFHVKLPYNFSRGGHDGQSYQITQWYPKPAVYDKNGWHPMPYLEQGEFYSEFGSFDVQITVPENYVVAATGDLQNEAEKAWIQTRKNFSWLPVIQKEKNNFGSIKSTKEKFPPSSVNTKTLEYKQDNIHDFAWFADKRFVVRTETMTLLSGKKVEVEAYYVYNSKTIWDSAVYFAQKAIQHYSTLVGQYPYSVVRVVEGPNSFGGGMEYPTITVISPMQNTAALDRVIAHELGHNWFYGILGTNERKHPWMDEGINTYYENLYANSLKQKKLTQFEQILLESLSAIKKDQPIETPSESFTIANYALVAYYKTSKWLTFLCKELGEDTFNKAMQSYYKQWQFKHPYPEDFKNSMEAVSGQNLDSTFSLLYKSGLLPDVVKKGTTMLMPLNVFKKMTSEELSKKNSVISLFPIVGFNSYDKLMAGITITNIKLPPNRFKFLLAPMYATGSKSLNGIGFGFYTFYPGKTFRKIDIGFTAAAFTNNLYKDSAGKKTFTGFKKIAPEIKFTFANKNARSSINKFIRLKSFLFEEDNLNFFRDSVADGSGGYNYFTNVSTISSNRVLNQLSLVIENNRVLYPFKGELRIEQGKDFIRPAFIGNYFFNYPKGGGLDVRLFAGKFIYTSPKTISTQFNNDRYHLNMTGANGFEDYSYSDYFIGRNKFEGMASQQIMMRDGGFKVRTDLLASKVGKTDDWLIATNFSTTLPSVINPFALLPVKIPVKVFFDLGTYAEAWKNKEALDRFLYDAGLQISFMKGIVNIYLPLVYSPVYKDYIISTIEKKKRFLSKISFSIDISNFNPRRIERNLSF
jgi:hypothetical protein